MWPTHICPLDWKLIWSLVYHMPNVALLKLKCSDWRSDASGDRKGTRGNVTLHRDLNEACLKTWVYVTVPMGGSPRYTCICGTCVISVLKWVVCGVADGVTAWNNLFIVLPLHRIKAVVSELSGKKVKCCGTGCQVKNAQLKIEMCGELKTFPSVLS